MKISVFAPTNIALIKYWGKRCALTHQPLVSSLSLTLPGWGTTTTLGYTDGADIIDGPGPERIRAFLDRFREPGEAFSVHTSNNIPTSAGLASSASGFAALTMAIDQLKGWNLSKAELSAMARLGSGSACRSFWDGLVLWDKDTGAAAPLGIMPDWFCMIGLLIDPQPKPISSRRAMEISLAQSPLAQEWPTEHARELALAMQYLTPDTFRQLGEVVEQNAIRMHRLLETSGISYDTQETLLWKKRLQTWREEGWPVYFTQDAGPNLKILVAKDACDALMARIDIPCLRLW